MGKTEAQIHDNMSKIRCKDTVIELTLRKELWARGIRYRKNVKTVEGKPDIAFIKKKVAVFCDSEFWHGYDWTKRKKEIKKNKKFWIAKIERNMQRDAEVNKILASQGWVVIRFWEEQILKETSKCADIIEETINNRNR